MVFGRSPAALGPETRSDGSGSKHGAERTQSEPRKPSIRAFRDGPDPQVKIVNVSLSEGKFRRWCLAGAYPEPSHSRLMSTS